MIVTVNLWSTSPMRSSTRVRTHDAISSARPSSALPAPRRRAGKVGLRPALLATSSARASFSWLLILATVSRRWWCRSTRGASLMLRNKPPMTDAEAGGLPHLLGRPARSRLLTAAGRCARVVLVGFIGAIFSGVSESRSG